MTIKLYELHYETYSYHGKEPVELWKPESDGFDLDDSELLGIYSSYDLALQRLQHFSKIYYISNLKRLNIYDAILNHSEWKDGFVTI